MQSPPSMTVGAALAGSGLASVDARVLLGHVLGRDRAWLVTHADDELDSPARRTFDSLVERRRAGEPIAYLTGRREFYGLDLRVSPAVLIPRPETETAVEVALMHMPMNEPCSVLDLGTGSGALALALATRRPKARVIATDVSPAALEVARANAAHLGLDEDRVRFVVSDWWSSVPDERFDVIVSNPPYVADGDPHLAEGDLRFEPALALRGGAAGLACIERIAASAARYLQPGGVLVIEHGYDQADAVRSHFVAAGLRDVAGTRDLAGIVRVTSGCWDTRSRRNGTSERV